MHYVSKSGNCRNFKFSGDPTYEVHCACHRSYLDSAAEEIGDQLQENGVVTVAELAKTYDLPGDFISQVAACVLNHEQISVHVFDVVAKLLYRILINL